MDNLDESLSLSETGVNEYVAYASPLFDGDSSIFGGWIAALIVQAVLEGAPADQRVLSLSIQYLRRVPPGAEIKINRDCLKSGRTLSQWRCDLLLQDSGAIAATAQICIGTRMETERFQDATMPAIVGPDGLKSVRMPFPCFDCLEERFEQGDTWFTNNGTTSLI